MSLSALFFNSKNTIPSHSPVLGKTDSFPHEKSTLEKPVRIRIPEINIDTQVEHVGLAGDTMDVPKAVSNVGWYDLGPRPGEIGSAVVAGHFDQKNGKAGVFNSLYKLQKGDKVYIEDQMGTIVGFVVRESRIYDTGFADEVFSRSDGKYLNLITCDGVWDGDKKSYTKRLVVFAKAVANPF